MITVSDGFFGIGLLTRVHGSAAYKAFIPSLISTSLLLTLHFAVQAPSSDIEDRWFGHPYPLASIVVAFTFLLTFKVRLLHSLSDTIYRNLNKGTLLVINECL